MNYRTIRVINEGGYGRVHEAIGDDGVHYALKELKFPNTVNTQRFSREVGILSSLSHPNIVRIFEWNLQGSPPRMGPWYVMELLHGGSLRDSMNNQFRTNVYSRRWTISEIMLPICQALSTAMGQGIIHRDLKPENVMFARSVAGSDLKVTDWGLGKDPSRASIALTQAFGVGGTPGYCAPEQWFSLDGVDSRADVFSLGVIFYEMMTGRRPPVYNNSMQRQAVSRPSTFHRTVSPQLDSLIMRMIELQREARPQSIYDMDAELRGLPDNYA